MGRGRVQGLKIYPKLLLGFIAISLIPMLGLSYQIVTHESDMNKKIKENMTQKSNLIANEINGWVDSNIRMLGFLSNREEMEARDAAKQTPFAPAARRGREIRRGRARRPGETECRRSTAD